MKQELELLNQFDTKDRALSTKQDKQQHDKKEVVTAIAACKAKLLVEQAEAEVWCPPEHSLHPLFRRSSILAFDCELGLCDRLGLVPPRSLRVLCSLYHLRGDVQRGTDSAQGKCKI